MRESPHDALHGGLPHCCHHAQPPAASASSSPLRPSNPNTPNPQPCNPQAPVLGSLASAALRRWAPGLDPREALLPITRLPGVGLPIPALVPLPNLQRLYFKILDPIDTASLGIDAKDTEGWQRVYDAIRGEGEARVWGCEGVLGGCLVWLGRRPGRDEAAGAQLGALHC